MTKEEIIHYLKNVRLHTWIEDYTFCDKCNFSWVKKETYRFKEEDICIDCAYYLKYLIIDDKIYETYDLRKNVIVQDADNNYYKISDTDNYQRYILRSFHPYMTNVEWYKYCFAYIQNIEDVTIKFDRSNKNHMWLFKQCTRFNHHSNYINFKSNCFRYNTNDETSVEQILDNIVTLRIIMLKYRVPRCLRDYIIKLYIN